MDEERVLKISHGDSEDQEMLDNGLDKEEVGRENQSREPAPRGHSRDRIEEESFDTFNSGSKRRRSRDRERSPQQHRGPAINQRLGGTFFPAKRTRVSERLSVPSCALKNVGKAKIRSRVATGQEIKDGNQVCCLPFSLSHTID